MTLQTTSRRGGLAVQYATHSGLTTSMPHGGLIAVKPRVVLQTTSRKAVLQFS